MKKYFSIFYILLAVFIVSCSNDGYDGLPSKTDGIIPNRQVSIKEADAFANKFFASWKPESVAGTTRAVEKNDYELFPIKSESGVVVMYAVNYKNSQGYILLSADKESNSIIAMADSGAINENSLRNNPAINQWLTERGEIIEEKLKEKLSLNNKKYELWNNITNVQDTIIEIEFIQDEVVNEVATRSHRDSNLLPWVNPSTSTYLEWGQGSPYNYRAKVSGALVGCPAVAVGMLCYNYFYPSGDWNYWSMSGKLTTSGDNHIARLFRYVADQMPGYTWSSTASGASPESVLIGIKALGYSDAVKQSYDLRTVHNNLINGYPVLLAGYQSEYGGGHIWYCDGYKEITYKCKKTILGITTSTWYEYDDMLYMNWGWNGESNGWFNEVDFGGNFRYDRVIYANLYPTN